MENIMMKLLFGDKKKSEKQPLKKVKQKGKIRQFFEKLVKKKSIDLKGAGETNVKDDISNINAMIVPDTNLKDANLLSDCLKHKEKSPTAHKEDKQIWVKLNNNKKVTFPDISMGDDDKSGQRQYRLKPLDFNELGLSANRESKMNICDWTNYKESSNKTMPHSKFRGINSREERVLRTPKPKLSEFRCHGVAGSGKFEMEFKVKLRNSTQEYALKFLNRRYFNRYENIASVRCIRSEINVLKTNKNHPFLVGLYAFYQTPRNYIIVRDFTSGGDLRSLLKRYGRLLEDHAIFYSAQIVIAIKYLHDNGIIHRDIKPESILLDRKGHEGIAKDEMVKGFCGTIPYMAPEIMRNEYYDFSVDWYSFGVVLYELLIGPVDLLGSDEATSRYYQAILSGPWRVSVEATSILNGFLNMNPEERLGSNLENGFNDISSHSFFASINWDRLQKKELYPPYKPKRNMKFGVLRYFFGALLYLAYMKDLM
ncbi:unnamed protein product [Gordionus sp. m RMFG-2023]